MTDRSSPSKMHHDEIEIDELLVRRLLAAQFPHWATLPLERVTSTGTVNAIFRLGNDMSVRLPRTPRWHNVEAEFCWLRNLAPHLPLAIPEALAVGEPDEAYPWKWSVFRWLEGESWRTDRLHDPRLDAAGLATFLQALEAIPSRAMPCVPCIEPPQLAHRDRAVRAYAAMADGYVDVPRFLRAWERALEVPRWDAEPVLVHSDVMAGNLLVREGQLAAVIDWASVHPGDPARDLEAGWRLFSGEARRIFKSAMPFDDYTWERARGWVLTSIVGVIYYAKTNPTFAAENQAALVEALADMA